MIILDTNVISELMKQTPDTRVIEWLDAQPETSIWTTSICVFEVRFGLELLPAGKRRKLLTVAFDESLRNDFGNRVLTFDVAAAHEAAVIGAAHNKKGLAVDIRDLEIAAITKVCKGTLATRNIKDFVATGITTVNPWKGK
jgi:hypothetical protein